MKSKPNSSVFLLAVGRGDNVVANNENHIDSQNIYQAMKPHSVFKSPEAAEDVASGFIKYWSTNGFMITNFAKGKESCAIGNCSAGEEKMSDDKLGVSEDIPPKTFQPFRETWIFDEIKTDRSGVGKLTKTLPDTAAIWDISAFALSKDYGFGLALPVKLTSVQEFLVDVHLPHSIRVGEILRVDVSIFNFLKGQRRASGIDVVLFRYKDLVRAYDEVASFEFYDVNERGAFTPSKENKFGMIVKCLTIPKQSETATHFYIKALKHGTITIRVRAEITSKRNFFDEVLKKLKVEPEGISQTKNQALLIDLRENHTNTYEFENNDYLTDSDKSSLKVEASLFGDLIGPALLNTDKLM